MALSTQVQQARYFVFELSGLGGWTSSSAQPHQGA